MLNFNIASADLRTKVIIQLYYYYFKILVCLVIMITVVDFVLYSDTE